jgi:sterol desaturase/sphingolipid hydroxylase (fatty acid hydroxylase superfamily)
MGRGKGSRSPTEKSTSFFEGFAGTTKGSFFEAPSWVDQSKPAGATSQEPAIQNNPNWGSLLTGQFLFWGPNLVWLVVALLDYFIFPYDFESAKAGFAMSWVMPRMWVNIGIVFGYFGFWHVTLYWMNWGKRPFKPDRVWSWTKVTHNMYYCLLGALQYTVWEAIFMFSYATGRIPHVTDAEAFATPSGLLCFVASFFIVPLFRELHFYFAHRFIHVKFLYKYVHALHHRNTDIEPFAGLCMHPIEHLYYYSCVGPSLYIYASPFGNALIPYTHTLIHSYTLSTSTPHHSVMHSYTHTLSLHLRLTIR